MFKNPIDQANAKQYFLEISGHKSKEFQSFELIKLIEFKILISLTDGSPQDQIMSERAFLS